MERGRGELEKGIWDEVEVEVAAEREELEKGWSSTPQ